MNRLIVGLQYGDEGKGRVSAYYADQHDWFVRFNGGPNAGHTVYKDGKKFSLHHLPAGAVFGKKIALDTGMVIDYQALIEECESIGLDYNNLYISNNVHLIHEDHKAQDALGGVNGSTKGSTKKGIAYVYSARSLRAGQRIEVCGYLMPEEKKQHRYYGLPPIGKNESVLYESAQGVMLDVDYGAYPYVTSSSVFPSCLHKVDKKIGIMKAYTSRVGDGPPYHRELPWLSEKGGEFGVTTGRTRKCYWLIKEEIEYAISLYNPDEIWVTKMDILEGESIRVVENGQERLIGNLDNYYNYLLSCFPQIKCFSTSPDGEPVWVA